MPGHRYVLAFQDLGREDVALVGGKGAHLGELSRIGGLSVPPGFCVTTDAFRRVVAVESSIERMLGGLARLRTEDRERIRALSADVRAAIESIAMPADLAAEISEAARDLGVDAAYAIRSSATAEDLPTTSFAGQHDSYLNVVGPAAILRHVSRCWASLFTERAVIYRLKNGVDHRKVHMAVVVQRMIVPRASGVLFTADPVTGNRKDSSIEATSGLGEGLVAGLVNADVYKVREGKVTASDPRHAQPALTDTQVVRLAAIGRRIEAHFGRPQDIEWCLSDDEFHVVQSRPITTLFPIPAAADAENHVYISVGHQQMMTDPMKPLGLSMWKLTAMAPMHDAGGRLFVDVTRMLASPASRAALFGLAGRSDPLIGDALETILARGDFVRSQPDAAPAPSLPGATPSTIETDPAVVARLIERMRDSNASAEREIGTKTGVALLDYILADIQSLKSVLFDPRSHQAIMAGVEATWWLNDRLGQWLGEQNAADTLAQSAPGNVTSEMGLSLLDVADVIRPHPEVVSFLERVEDDGFLDELPKLPGGPEARDAILAWLDRYGMRCAGEIDITRPRWSERPATLLPAILGNVRNFEPAAGRRRFEQGLLEASRKEREVLERLRGMPDGERMAEETKRVIDRLRTFIGYREYPKYGMISRYFIYRQALLREADRLVRSRVLREREDISWLTFQELHDVARTNRVDERIIHERKDEFRSFQALKPPRVLTSDGEMITGSYRREDVPAGALVGLAVSAGTVEGRARVILDMAQADLEPGDILVTPFTDPSWTPLFVAISGLVTEVGGLMTHGAVIAREYGLPAVVGVGNATQLIRDGDRIRVHGAGGYVEIVRGPAGRSEVPL
ncbi:MAG TPA: rifamycin-inactivating phosphotransferase [Gemmatimonadaceae bacterium]|nr:rifamycin-inactivating phosphotransferase [Gemmatimonadaceae bacterium]